MTFKHWRERRALLIAVAFVAVALVVAITDLKITSGSLPETPAACPAGASSACEDARTDVFQDRATRMYELSGQFETRAWIYSLLACAAIAFAVFRELRARPGPERAELFADLGVAGVGGLLLTAVVLGTAAGGFFIVPTAPFWFFSAALVVMAMLGAAAMRLAPADRVSAAGGSGADGDASPYADRRPTLSRVSTASLGSTALAVLFAFVYLNQVPECGEPIPDSADVWAWVTIVFAAGGMIGALGCLGQRRWIAALVCFGVSACALIGTALAGLC